MPPIALGPRTWPSKKLCQEYLRAVLRGDEPLDQSVLTALLARHPEAESKGQGTIEIFDDGLHRCLAVRGSCGLQTFSIATALSGREETKAAAMNHVMRSEINEQILQVRHNSQTPLCASCGCSGRLEVDHIRPFAELRETWLAGRTLEVERWRGGGRFKDEALSCSWQQFHQENATYQLLCVACHRQKTVEGASSRN